MRLSRADQRVLDDLLTHGGTTGRRWVSAAELYPQGEPRWQERRDRLRALSRRRIVKTQTHDGTRRYAAARVDVDEDTCRVCGCTEFDACWDDELGACWWVEEDLCSHCAPPEARAVLWEVSIHGDER